MNHTLRSTLVFALLTIVGCSKGPADPPAYNKALYNIKLISQTITLGWSNDVWVENDTAYIADDEQGVSIWNVRNLRQPVCVDTIPTMLTANGATISQAERVSYSPLTGILAIGPKGKLGGAGIIDRWQKRYLDTFGSQGSVGLCLRTISSDSLLVAEVETDEGLRFGTFTRSEFGWLKTQVSPQLGNNLYYGVLLRDSCAYLADGEFGLSIVQLDYSSPIGNFTVTQLGAINTPGSSRDVAVNRDGTVAAVADYNSGLQVIDISDKTNPRIAGSMLPDGVNEALLVRCLGDTAIFTDKYNGIFAVDITDPANPRLVGVYNTPNPVGLYVRESDRTIFLADLQLGLLILQFK